MEAGNNEDCDEQLEWRCGTNLLWGIIYEITDLQFLKTWRILEIKKMTEKLFPINKMQYEFFCSKEYDNWQLLFLFLLSLQNKKKNVPLLKVVPYTHIFFL